MKILAVDIGLGTQDILLYDDRKNLENCVKLVLPSPTKIFMEKAEEKMRKKLLVSLVTGMVILGNVFIANAIPTEIVPVSYTFDKTTDVGTYNYSDWTGSQLTDGHYGITPWSADLGNGHAYSRSRYEQNL